MGFGQYSANGPWSRVVNNTEAADTNPDGGRAKHVLDTSDVPHAWAHPLEKDGSGYYQSHARNPQSNLFYKTSTDGTRVLYSYRDSYPIGSLFTVKKGKTLRRVYLTFGDKPYSVTTAGHCNMSRGAVPRSAIHWDVQELVSSFSTKPTKAEHVKNVSFLAGEYEATAKKLARAHSMSTIQWEQERATRQRKDALEYAQFFGVKVPKLSPLPTITSERRERARTFDANSSTRRARIRTQREERWRLSEEEYKAARENERKQLPERIALWRQGQAVGYLSLDYALLRMIERDGAASVETSQGAKVPVSGHSGAARLFHFLKALVEAKSEYTRNGHTQRIGAFTVDSFKPKQLPTVEDKPGIASGEPEYVLTAGCHVIKWSEIEAIAPAVLAAETPES